MFDVTHYWYRRSLHPITLALLPFAWIFRMVLAARRFAYRVGILRVHYFPVPVIIVGNITVGGTGKTPMVIWLANFLRSHGYSPGIISRGYSGKRHTKPFRVTTDSLVTEVGDEAILLAKHANCPVMISSDRVAGVRDLLQQSNCNMIVSDDGLQHLRLGRAIEIAMVDGLRRFGNQCLLPAGPLREPTTRLNHIDLVVVNAGNKDDKFTMQMMPMELISLKDQHKKNIFYFSHKKVHAVAGIGHPERFFGVLRQAGLDVIPHAFPDHYPLRSDDICFNDDFPVIMTEKDAVKCESFADERHWYLTATVNINNAFKQKLLLLLQSLEVRGEYKNKFAKHACSADYSMQHGDICK